MFILYDLIGYILSTGIIFFFSISFYYNCKYFKITKCKASADWIYLIITGVSLAWIIIFSYIEIETIIGKPPLSPSSFGAIFIRPLILLTSVGTAISARMRYRLQKGTNQWKSTKI